MSVSNEPVHRIAEELAGGVLKVDVPGLREVKKLIANREHPPPKDINPLLRWPCREHRQEQSECARGLEYRRKSRSAHLSSSLVSVVPMRRANGGVASGVAGEVNRFMAMAAAAIEREPSWRIAADTIFSER